MKNNEMENYITYGYQIFPTTEQRNLLDRRFQLVDKAYDTYAELANEYARHNITPEEIDFRLQFHIMQAETAEDRYAINEARKRIKALLPRLCSGKMAAIKLRTSLRQQRSYTYTLIGLSEYHLVLPTIGAVAMEAHNIPIGAKIYYATVYADNYGTSYHVDIVIKEPESSCSYNLEHERKKHTEFCKEKYIRGEMKKICYEQIHSIPSIIIAN